MKITIIATVVWGLVVGGAAPLAEAKDKPVTVFFNAGLMLNGFIIPEELTFGFKRMCIWENS